MKYKDYKPVWRTSVNERNSYRTLFRWGNPNYRSEPSEEFYEFIKERLCLTNEDFMLQSKVGDNLITIDIKSALSKADIKEFTDIVGKVNVGIDTLSRVKSTYAKGVLDSMRLRSEIIENVPDIVLSPSSEEQITMILKYCNRHSIPVYSAGGNTNTTRSNESYKGGVKIDFKRNYNKVISFSEIDQTVTVMPGITGPQLENILNNANDYFTNVSGRFTCGHFPESFEFSTVGGWVSTRSIGQASLRYGGVDDILISAKYLTPKGIVDTSTCNRNVGMPSFDEIMMGSDGNYALLLSCTLKVRKYTYDNKKFFAYIMSDWDTAVRCVREIVQRESGLPSVLKLCDVDSTELMVRMSKLVNKGPIASVLERFGSARGTRCMVLGYSEGEKFFSGYVKRSVSRVCQRFGAYTATGRLSKKWEKVRFNNAYIRDILQDYDIIMDEITSYVSWSSMQEVYLIVKEFFNDIDVLSMIQLYDISAQGAMMSLTYMNRFKSMEEYTAFHGEVLDMLLMAGAKSPQSHSVGQTSNETVNNLPEIYVSTLKAIKRHLDPKGILNPISFKHNDVRKDTYADVDRHAVSLEERRKEEKNLEKTAKEIKVSKNKKTTEKATKNEKISVANKVVKGGKSNKDLVDTHSAEEINTPIKTEIIINKKQAADEANVAEVAGFVQVVDLDLSDNAAQNDNIKEEKFDNVDEAEVVDVEAAEVDNAKADEVINLEEYKIDNEEEVIDVTEEANIEATAEVHDVDLQISVDGSTNIEETLLDTENK